MGDDPEDDDGIPDWQKEEPEDRPPHHPYGEYRGGDHEVRGALFCRICQYPSLDPLSLAVRATHSVPVGGIYTTIEYVIAAECRKCIHATRISKTNWASRSAAEADFQAGTWTPEHSCWLFRF